MKNEVMKNDYTLIEDYESYELERINGMRISFNDWLNTYSGSISDDIFIVLSRPFVLGESLDAFISNGLACIEKGLKIVFKCRFNLSFHKMIDYTVFTTTEQQKAAFSSVYSIVMPDVYSHKIGRKRDVKTAKLLRSYWLAYVYKYSKNFKGSITAKEIFQNLHISSKTVQELKYEVQSMLDKGKQAELEAMVVNEMYSKKECNASEHADKRKDSKQLEKFKEKLTKALSSDTIQLELFASDDVTEAID